MRHGSTIVALLAWVFLVWQLSLSMVAPDWLAALTLVGFVLCLLVSLILSWFEKKRQMSSWRFGFWLGIAALAAIAVVIILPLVG